MVRAFDQDIADSTFGRSTFHVDPGQRSHFEYAVCVWNPHHQHLIEKLEKVQKHATKLVLRVKKLHYEDRLRQLQLRTLKYRRIRGDMIELYKIFAGTYDDKTTE